MILYGNLKGQGLFRFRVGGDLYVSLLHGPSFTVENDVDLASNVIDSHHHHKCCNSYFDFGFRSMIRNRHMKCHLHLVSPDESERDAIQVAFCALAAATFTERPRA